MPREDSPYIVGEFWLDHRRDGASPDIWQAATYKRGSRQVVYKSTKCRDIADAKPWLDSYWDKQRAKQSQPVDEAKVVPALFNYWDEHGKKAERPDSIACSIRLFLGFLMQDEAGVNLTMDQADRALFKRFIDWRMHPHSYEVPWGDKTISGASEGVKGETVQSDLSRVAAALNRQEDFGRIPVAPKVPGVDKKLRSQPREYLYTVDQMGAIMWVAAHDVDMFRWLLLQLGTIVRPEAALLFDPRTQWRDSYGLIDLHPVGKPRTRKRNPVVPAIPELVPFLEAWARDGAIIVKSRKRAWRTIRRVLSLPQDAVPKTIRYSVATLMRNQYRVDHEQVEVLLGHRVYKGVSERYAKYDPHYMAESAEALSKIFQRVAAAAYQFGAVHLLSMVSAA